MVTHPCFGKKNYTNYFYNQLTQVQMTHDQSIPLNALKHVTPLCEITNLKH
jgi:hypothetical protein